MSDAPSISTRSDDVYFKKSNLSLIQQEFQPIKFFDLTYSVEDSSETSKINNDEVDFIEQLIKRFVIRVARNNLLNSDNLFVKNFAKKELNSEHRRQAMTDLKGLIGIISPYKSQVRQIKDKVYRLLRQFCDI